MTTWTGAVDPNSEEYANDGGGGGERTRWCEPGKKVLAAIGFERWESKTGTPMLSIRFVCLLDLETGENDAGDRAAHVWRNFALTQNAVQFFARYARAAGHLSPFNVFSDEDIQAILSRGAVIGKIEQEVYEGKTKSEVKFFDRYQGEWEPDFDAILDEAGPVWDAYLEWRASNPRGQAPKGKPQGGQRGGGKSGSGSGRSHQHPSDDDIPF